VIPAIEMAKRRKYPLSDMISHRFPLEKAEHALALVGGDLPGEYPMKVVLDPAMTN
jgi:alcohol dehydrogenase